MTFYEHPFPWYLFIDEVIFSSHSQSYCVAVGHGCPEQGVNAQSLLVTPVMEVETYYLIGILFSLGIFILSLCLSAFFLPGRPVFQLPIHLRSDGESTVIEEVHERFVSLEYSNV